MHLIHHDERQIGQQVRIRIEHVAQHLGRHHDDPRVGVDVGVPGEESHVLRAVLADELLELLVAQGLHRRGVEDLRVGLLHGEEDGELGDDGLAGAGRRGDQHAPAALQARARLALERIEVEPQPIAERLELRLSGARPRSSVALGRGELVGHRPSLGAVRWRARIRGASRRVRLSGRAARTRPPPRSRARPSGWRGGTSRRCPQTASRSR